MVTSAQTVEFQYAIHQLLHYWISWMWHRYWGTTIPIIDRIVLSIPQLMQVGCIDQSSHELGPQSIYSYGCVLVICGVACEACGSVTVARDFLILRCPWTHQAARHIVFKSHRCGREKQEGREEGRGFFNYRSFAFLPLLSFLPFSPLRFLSLFLPLYSKLARELLLC